MPAQQLSIVVVTWNSESFIGDCLRSIDAARKGIDCEVLVVDNASTDGTREVIESQFPWVELIESQENLGFARGNNLALLRASGSYCLLLNPDTVLTSPDVLRTWVAYMDDRPDVGASGVRLVLPDGRHQVGDAGFRPSLRTAASHFLLLSQLFGGRIRGLFVTRPPVRDPLEVDWVSGAALLVRSDVIRKVGAMDESIFLYAEDVEWGCRMRDHGVRIHYLPELEILHLQGACAEQNPEVAASVPWLHNLRALYIRYDPRAPAWLFDVLVTLGLALRAGLYALRAMLTGDPRSRRRSREMRAFLAAWATRGSGAGE